MKKNLFFIPVLLILAACNVKPKTELQAVENVQGTVYGDSVENTNALDAGVLLTAMKNQSKMDMKVKGKVEFANPDDTSVMTMKLSNGENMPVSFTDGRVIIPKNLRGKEVVVDGFAHIDTTSIEDLKARARSDGKTKAEIAGITTPKTRVVFAARGMVVLK